MTFRPDLGGQLRHLVEPVFDRIGADAVRDLGELRQILGYLLRRDVGGCDERRLRATERRVGHAQELGVGIDRRARQGDRSGHPPPRRGDRAKGYYEKRQRRTKRNRFHPPGGSSITRSSLLCQGQVAGTVEIRPRLYHNTIKL